LGKRGAEKRRVNSSLGRPGRNRKTHPATDPRITLSRLTTWLLLASLVVFAYGGSLQNGFVLDEAVDAAKEARIESLLGVTKVFTDTSAQPVAESATDASPLTYRPLQIVILSSIDTLFDGAAWPSHLLNLLLHLFNSVLVYAILRRLLDSRPGALGLAAIFATHPAFSDSVLWVSDVAGLGASFCVLLALYIHLRRLPAFGGSLGVGALYLGGLCFKESAALLPVLMLLIDLYSRTSDPEDYERRIAWGDYGLLFAPLGIYGALRFHTFGYLLPPEATDGANTIHLVATAIALLPRYAWELLYSFRPTLPRAVAPSVAWTDVSLYVGFVMAVGAAGLAFSLRRTRPLAVLGIVWLAVTLIPHLVAGWPQTNLFSERYLYLPSIGFLIFVGALMDFTWGTPREVRNKRIAFVCAVTVLASTFAWIDYERTKDWKSEEAIIASVSDPSRTVTKAEAPAQSAEKPVAAETPSKTPAATAAKAETKPADDYSVGLAHLERGKYPDAVAALERARSREPYNADVLYALATSYTATGETFRAVESYFRIVETQPDASTARQRLGQLAYDLGYPANARIMLSEAQERATGSEEREEIARLLATVNTFEDKPIVGKTISESALNRNGIAMKKAEDGHLRDAIVYLKATSWLEPSVALLHHSLAKVHRLAGMQDKALPHARTAAQLEPENQAYVDDLARTREQLGYVVEVPEAAPAAEAQPVEAEVEQPASGEAAEIVVKPNVEAIVVPAADEEQAVPAQASGLVVETPANKAAPAADSATNPADVLPATETGGAAAPAVIESSSVAPAAEPVPEESIDADPIPQAPAADAPSAETASDPIGAAWSTTAEPEPVAVEPVQEPSVKLEGNTIEPATAPSAEAEEIATEPAQEPAALPAEEPTDAAPPVPAEPAAAAPAEPVHTTQPALAAEAAAAIEPEIVSPIVVEEVVAVEEVLVELATDDPVIVEHVVEAEDGARILLPAADAEPIVVEPVLFEPAAE
jgi:tetratricopeptide (TPR) repeat protein